MIPSVSPDVSTNNATFYTEKIYKNENLGVVYQST
jgi:hypothetical protein